VYFGCDLSGDLRKAVVFLFDRTVRGNKVLKVLKWLKSGFDQQKH